jgi:hypothetical protein
METLAEHDGKTYHAITIERGDDFVSPFNGFAFPCLIWDHDSHFSQDERIAVASRLLAAGCRYVVCGGSDCSVWHDVVDLEWVREHLDEPDEVQAAAHVMTTWHTGQTPDDVAFFFVQLTNFDDHDFKRFLIVHVGSGGAVREVNTAVRKQALGEDAV